MVFNRIICSRYALFLVGIVFLSISLVNGGFLYDYSTRSFQYSEPSSMALGTTLHVFTQPDISYYGPEVTQEHDNYRIVVNTEQECISLRDQFQIPQLEENLLPVVTSETDPLLKAAIHRVTSPHTRRCFSIVFTTNTYLPNTMINIDAQFSRTGIYPAHNLHIVKQGGGNTTPVIEPTVQFDAYDDLTLKNLPNTENDELTISKFGELPCYTFANNVYTAVSGITDICDINLKLAQVQLEHTTDLKIMTDKNAILIKTPADPKWEILECIMTGESTLAIDNVQGTLFYPDSQKKNEAIFEFPRRYIPNSDNYPLDYDEIPDLTCKFRWTGLNANNWSDTAQLPVSTDFIMNDDVMFTKTKNYEYSNILTSLSINSQLKDMMSGAIDLVPSSNYYYFFFQSKQPVQIRFFINDCGAEVFVDNNFTPKANHKIPSCTNLPKNSDNKLYGFTCTPHLNTSHQIRVVLSKYNNCKMSLNLYAITPEPLLTNIPLPDTTNLYQEAIIKTIPSESDNSIIHQIYVAYVISQASSVVTITPPAVNYNDFVYDLSNCPDWTQTADDTQKRQLINSATLSPSVFTNVEPQIVECTVNVLLNKFFEDSKKFDHIVKLSNGKTVTLVTSVPLPQIPTTVANQIVITKDSIPENKNEFSFDIKLPFTMSMSAPDLYRMLNFKATTTFHMDNTSIKSCTLQEIDGVLSQNPTSNLDVAVFNLIPANPNMFTSTSAFQFELLCKGVHTQKPEGSEDDSELNMSIDLELSDSGKIYNLGNFKMPFITITPSVILQLDLAEVKLESTDNTTSLLINKVAEVKPNDEILVLLDSSIAYYGPNKVGSTDDYSWTVLNEETCNAARVKHNLPLLSNGSPINPIVPGLNDVVLDALLQDTTSIDTKRCFSVKILKELETLNINIPIATSRYGTFPQHNMHLVASRGEVNDSKSVNIPSFSLLLPEIKTNFPFSISKFGEDGCYVSENNETGFITNKCNIIFRYNTRVEYSTPPLYPKTGLVIDTGNLDWDITHCGLIGYDITRPSLIKRYIKDNEGNDDKSKIVLNIDFSMFLDIDTTTYPIPDIICAVHWPNYLRNSWSLLPVDYNVSSNIVMYDALVTTVQNTYSNSDILTSVHVVSEFQEIMSGIDLPIPNTLNYYYLYFTPTKKATYTFTLNDSCDAKFYSDVSIDVADVNKYNPSKGDTSTISPQCTANIDLNVLSCIIDEKSTDALHLVRFALTNINSCFVDISVTNSEIVSYFKKVNLPSNEIVSNVPRIEVIEDSRWGPNHLSIHKISISQVILKESSKTIIKPIVEAFGKVSYDVSNCPNYTVTVDSDSKSHTLISPEPILRDGVYVPTIIRCEVVLNYDQFIDYHEITHEITTTSIVKDSDSRTASIITNVPFPIFSLQSDDKREVTKGGLVAGTENEYKIELKFDIKISSLPIYKMSEFDAFLLFTMPTNAVFTTCTIGEINSEIRVDENSRLEVHFSKLPFSVTTDQNQLSVNNISIKCTGTHVEETSRYEMIYVILSLDTMNLHLFGADFTLPAAEETVDVYETFLSIISESGLTLDEREKLLNLYKETINKGNESGTATEVYIKDWVTKTLEDMRVVDEVTFSIDDDDIIREHVEDTLDDLRNEIINDTNHSDWLVETKVIAGGGEGEGSGGSMPKRCRTSCGKGCLCGLGKTCESNQDCMSAICHIAKTPASRVYFLNESKGTCVNKIPEDDKEKEIDKDNSAYSISLVFNIIVGTIIMYSIF